MKLGNFSISLNVSNLKKSLDFYSKLGFVQIGGEESQNWLIMQNDQTVIGLFQGMFESNIMTFNPGWDSDGKELKSFTDIREIQESLRSSDVAIQDEVDEESTGPASFMVTDPDGNTILFDQHR